MLLCPSQSSSAPTGGLLASHDTTGGGCAAHYEWEIDTLGADSEHCPDDDADYSFFAEDVPAIFGNPASSAVAPPAPHPVNLPVTRGPPVQAPAPSPPPPPPPTAEPRRAREESLDAWVSESSIGIELDGNLDGLMDLCPGGICDGVDIDMWDCPTLPSPPDAQRSPSPAARRFPGRTAQPSRPMFVARDLPAHVWPYGGSGAVNCNAPAVRTANFATMRPPAAQHGLSANRAAPATTARAADTRTTTNPTVPVVGAAALPLSTAGVNMPPSWPRNNNNTKAGFAVAGVQLQNRHIGKAGARPAKVLFSQENLAGVYHLPRETAAVELGIGCTYLKKICRGYGIKRWPSRKLAALNNHIGELTVLVTKLTQHRLACADMIDDMNDAIADAKGTKDKIYKDPNHTITRDLYRELHTFRKRADK